MTTAAFYLSIPGNPTSEFNVAQLVGALTVQALEEAGFSIIAIDVLDPGSYGAIIFVESNDPETLKSFADRLRAVGQHLTQALKEEVKSKVARCILIVVIGGVGYLVYPHQPEIDVVCSPDHTEDLKRNIAEARTSDEIARIFRAYCSDNGSILRRVLEEFGLR